MLNTVRARDGSLCPSMGHGQFAKAMNSINKSILHALAGAIDLGTYLLKVGVVAQVAGDDLGGILVGINEVQCCKIEVLEC